MTDKHQQLREAASLHDQIMNLACNPENMDSEPNQRLAYKVGHRDARHAAAEIAASQAAAISALLADLDAAVKERDAAENALSKLYAAVDSCVELTPEVMMLASLTLSQIKAAGREQA